jgi:hypothetical protein
MEIATSRNNVAGQKEEARWLYRWRVFSFLMVQKIKIFICPTRLIFTPFSLLVSLLGAIIEVAPSSGGNVIRKVRVITEAKQALPEVWGGGGGFITLDAVSNGNAPRRKAGAFFVSYNPISQESTHG